MAKAPRQFTKGALSHCGARVTTLEGLAYLRSERKSVICPTYPVWRFPKPRPAAWIIQLPGAMLLNMMECGLYVYEKGNTQ